MGSKRLKQLLLGGLTLLFAILIYRAWSSTSAAAPPSSNQGRTATRARTRSNEPALEAPDVRLDALSAERARPEPDRNLFRFKPPSAPPPKVERGPEMAPPVATGPPPPPPVAPITLKFIGIIDRGGKKIAVLSDSAGHVDYGGEGAIIGGRYRVLKIGVESIEMAHLDGRGRQTIRLTGS